MILGAHSYYSLRYGVLPPEQLVKLASAAGHSAMALTDINNVTAMFDFVKAARRYGIHPVAGMEIRLGDQLLYTAIARNENGFMQLNEWFSQHVLNRKPIPERPDDLADVFWIYPWGRFPSNPSENEWLGVRLDDRGRLLTAPKQWLTRTVIRHPFTFTTDLGFQFHRHLRAIDHNTLLSKIQPSMTALPNDRLFTPHEFKSAFDAWPDLYENTRRLLSQCQFDPDFDSPKNKQTYTGSRADDHILLRKLTYEGFEYRYGEGTPYARQRLDAELDTICRLGFAAYFLITHDIIHYSLSQGIYHVGRGSGANSLVAYCLCITDVDPIELNLYFERFINPKRTSPPDFDIDYSWRDRDRILEYIFRRFGYRHTALLGTTVTFQTNAAVRELAKVYGLPKTEVDQLLKAPNRPANRDEVINTVLYLAKFLTDFPNLRSIHAGGVLISEKPIYAYTALDMPPKGFQTTQWDMYVAESIGFEKIDILSQRGIGHINECVEIIHQNRGIDIDVHRVEAFKRDQKSLDLLYRGETIGCFYIESPAMRSLLKKLRCRDYKTLVAASSIIRPGVAQSGMMAEFIRRFHNPKGFKYLHPIIEEQLSETFGIMVYQEDVLKVCHHFAGLDLADADVLRRLMSGKHRKKGDLERISDRFFENCRQRGYPHEVVHELWRQISSFARYSFSKAHSASYAAESFQSLYLKAHFPL
ncbi:MAG TPA: PHP domain-containing protein, partial [Salinivirgaceae bacterium]|nr:PHP domain-containing protein [Salinivirgaceae bacterium]